MRRLSFRSRGLRLRQPGSTDHQPEEASSEHPQAEVLGLARLSDAHFRPGGRDRMDGTALRRPLHTNNRLQLTLSSQWFYEVSGPRHAVPISSIPVEANRPHRMFKRKYTSTNIITPLYPVKCLMDVAPGKRRFPVDFQSQNMYTHVSGVAAMEKSGPMYPP